VGCLNLASEAAWMKVEFPVYDVAILEKASILGRV